MKMIRIGMLTVLGVVASIQMAQATVSKITPGSVCQPVDAKTDVVGYNGYGVYNLSTTSTATVMCPLLLDFGSSATLSLHLGAVVYDRNTTSDVNCMVLVESPEGNVEQSPSFGSSGGGPGTGVQNPGLGPVIVSNNDMVILQCTIPPRQSGWLSVLSSFWVTQ
jgi:hypothetical protein